MFLITFFVFIIFLLLLILIAQFKKINKITTYNISNNKKYYTISGFKRSYGVAVNKLGHIFIPDFEASLNLK